MERKRTKIWNLREGERPAPEVLADISGVTGLSEVAARLLCCRGIRDGAGAARFLSCEDTAFHSPFLLRDMEKAVARIRRAVDTGERIVIYGDYDVDGVTSVSLLYLYLTGLGADVGYYIPSRSGEGYGVSTSAVQKLAEAGAGLILTVDTGITANAEVAFAAKLGIDMVITDHHECRLPLPEAVAVVNPHRPDCDYPFKELAGVGVAFKLASAIEAIIGMERGEGEIDGVRRVSARFADLVAIGTVADVMPIKDENRLIVRQGISCITSHCRTGLAALIEEANRPAGESDRPPKARKITSTFIGFVIAPRLNAAGRMSEATLAVDLLLAETPERAHELARRLCEINRARQAEENSIAEQVYRRIEEEFDPETTRVLVLEDNHWRQGIIGIVSSRVTERYGLPSILISFDGAVEGFESPDDRGKGSGRSVKGVNLVEALVDSEELLVKFGGHELAAGLTVTRGNLDAFRARINAYAARFLPVGGAEVSLDADLEIPLSAANMDFANELLRLEPFGTGNPTPQFILRDVTILHITELGGGKHLKLLVSDGTATLPALCFSTPRSRFDFAERDRVDLLCTIDINEYRNQKSVQLVVQDIKPGAAFGAHCAGEEARYLAIRAGESFDDPSLVPEYADFAHTYTVLRREFRQGNDTFAFPTLLMLVNADAPRQISYVALRYILEIFHELQICGVEELPGLLFRFDVYFNASKTNIERSYLLKKLRSQLKRGE